MQNPHYTHHRVNECSCLWLLKNSFAANSRKKLCDRKLYKRRSPISWTFTIPKISAILTKSEFFNSHAWFRQPVVNSGGKLGCGVRALFFKSDQRGIVFSAKVAAHTARAMTIPVSIKPKKAIRMATTLDALLIGRRSPYPTVVAVMKDQ